MGRIADIFRQYGEEYLRRYGDRMPAGHRKVVDAIRECRTAASGVRHYRCLDCEERKTVYLGCGDRHCPNCQEAKNREWLKKKLEEQLPGPHFLITFTIPKALRALARSKQKIVYKAMFDASSGALKTLAADPRYIGGDLAGFFGILHTWGRQLSYHPHIHYVVPGGALDRASGLWKPSHRRFFAPVRALSKLFRSKVHDALRGHGFLDQVETGVWKTNWTVNSQAVGHNAKGALKYLAPYVFRVAISDRRVVRFEDGRVTFRYRDSKTNAERTMTLEALEFMRRFLQHVLPKGFMKIRYYGFMAPGSTVVQEELATMIEMALNFESLRPEVEPEPETFMVCPRCGGMMVLVATLLPHEGQSLALPVPC